MIGHYMARKMLPGETTNMNQCLIQFCHHLGTMCIFQAPMTFLLYVKDTISNGVMVACWYEEIEQS